MPETPDRTKLGFTIVEMLIAVVVAGVLGTALVRLFALQNQAYIRQNAGVLASQNARAGFDMLVREVRNAGYDPRGIAGASITSWASDSLGWTADLNADGDLLDSGEGVAYYLDASDETLVRREGLDETAVADGVTNLRFRYLQGPSGPTATTADEVRYIRVEVSFATPQGVMDGRIETQVAVRNYIY